MLDTKAELVESKKYNMSVFCTNSIFVAGGIERGVGLARGKVKVT